MKAALLVMCIVLAGCGAKGPVYLQRPCAETIPTRPTMPTERMSEDVDTFVWVRGAIAELERREGYEGQLRQALYNCTR